MGDTTDELLDLAEQVSPLPPGRELDMLLTAGERISMALLAMAIANLGQTARSFTGSQAGVITDSVARPRQDHRRHARAGSRTRSPRATSRSSPASRASRWTPRTSPRSAAAARTRPRSRSPPRSTPTCARSTPTSTASSPPTRGSSRAARRIPQVSYEEMLEMCASGAKVLHLRCVEYARRYGMPIHVRSSFSQKTGTWVTDSHEGELDGASDHLRRRARPQRGQDHGRRRARTSSARPPGSSRRSPTPRSTST